MEGEARYMRRKVKAGIIEADHDECALVVHYEVEATVLGELGEPIVAERQENTKKVRLKTLNENTNIQKLALEILDKVKLIHESKLPQVERLLEEMVTEKIRRERSGGSSRTKKGKRDGKKQPEDEKPALEKMEEYIERMYEEPEAATQATYMILQLARSPENLEPMLEHEALLGLLARLLQEEGPKSMDLAINIIYILYSFSNFSQFHPALFQARVGDNVLKVVDLEMKRHKVREYEKVHANDPNMDPKEKEKRHRLMLRKQEKLLYVCFHVLLNLSEEPDIERKMARRGIVPSLILMLSRSNHELLVLVLLFLTKLAIFKENLPHLRGHGEESGELIKALIPFVPHNNEALVATALRLLFNLSFDAEMRTAIVGGEMLPKLTRMLSRKQQLPLILRLLYNLSAEKEGRAAICASEAPRAITKQVLACAEPALPLELAALAVNLAADEKGAAGIADEANGGEVVRKIVDRLYQTHDPHLCKLLRNLASHPTASQHVVPFTADLIALAQQADQAELLVELLGVLGAMPLHTIGELPHLADKYDLIDFIARHLVPGFADDDILLEAVIVIGALAAHPECAARFSRTRVLSSLYTLVTEKQEDDEVVLQILYAFYHLLQAAEPRYSLLQQTQLVVYLLDLLMDKNEQVRRMADLCLDAVMENDEAWAPQIRQRKFQMHNREWLEVVDEDEAEEYNDAVALNDAMNSIHDEGPLSPGGMPLDASQLDDDEYGYGEGDSQASPGPEFDYGGGYDAPASGYCGAGAPASAYGGAPAAAYGLSEPEFAIPGTGDGDYPAPSRVDSYGGGGYRLDPNLEPGMGGEPGYGEEVAEYGGGMGGGMGGGYGELSPGADSAGDGGYAEGYAGVHGQFAEEEPEGYGGEGAQYGEVDGGYGGYGGEAAPAPAYGYEEQLPEEEHEALYAQRGYGVGGYD